MADPTPPPASMPAAQPETTPDAKPGAQQRGQDGKFMHAAKAPPPEPPRRFKLPGTEEELSEEELLAAAAERRLEGRGLQAQLKRLRELEAEAEKRKKNPLDGLSREERRRLAVLEAREWQAEEEEANLPPAEKAMRQRERMLREREQKLKDEEDRRTQEAEQAQMEQFRTEAVETVKTAMELSGLPPTPGTAKRLLGLMKTAVEGGVAMPPEVLARKLRVSADADAQAEIKALGGAKVLRRWPAMVEELNALEDPEALELLAPLGERLRRRALEGRGLAPAAQASDNVRHLPPAPKASASAPQDPWAAEERIKARLRR